MEQEAEAEMEAQLEFWKATHLGEAWLNGVTTFIGDSWGGFRKSLKNARDKMQYPKWRAYLDVAMMFEGALSSAGSGLSNILTMGFQMVEFKQNTRLYALEDGTYPLWLQNDLDGFKDGIKGGLESLLVLRLMGIPGADSTYGNAIFTDNAPYLKWIGETYRRDKPILEQKLNDYVKNMDSDDVGALIFDGASVFVGPGLVSGAFKGTKAGKWLKGWKALDTIDDAGDTGKIVGKLDDVAGVSKGTYTGDLMDSITAKRYDDYWKKAGIGSNKTWEGFLKHNPNSGIDDYFRLVKEQSPWPDGYTPNKVTLAGGDTFEMAISKGQKPTNPGRFATTTGTIEDINYVRDNLAVKVEWKPDVDRVVTYKVKEGVSLPALQGPVGPQIDLTVNQYLKGGADQINILLDRGTNAMDYLEIVSIRNIK
jgi:hypothetical protein